MLLFVLFLHCCWSRCVSGDHPYFGDQWVWNIYSFCPPKFTSNSAHRIPLGGDSFIPVLATKQPGRKATSAVIILPGVYRESEGMMTWMTKHILKCSEKQCAEDSVSTLLVAPIFPGTPCTAEMWNDGPKSLHSLVWSKGDYWVHPTQWVFGGFDDDNNITSLEVVDHAIRWVEQNYPALQQISVVGNSAGAQLLQRWTIVSSLGVDGKSPNGRMALTSIITEPATWLYFNEQRPNRSCTPDTDTGPTFRCGTFPSVTSLSQASQSSCNDTFNRWPFGLGDLLGSEPATIADCGQDGMFCMGVEVQKYVLTASGDINSEHMQRQYRTKDVRFLIGAWDTHSCAQYACTDMCSAMTQGCNRLQRLVNYMEYLRQTFPGFEPVFGTYLGGHNWKRAFKDKNFLDWINVTIPSSPSLPSGQGPTLSKQILGVAVLVATVVVCVTVIVVAAVVICS